MSLHRLNRLLEAFVALRDRLDPGGLLADDHLDHVLGKAVP